MELSELSTSDDQNIKFLKFNNVYLCFTSRFLYVKIIYCCECIFNIVKTMLLGIIHILRNHQGGGGFRNDYANIIFALSNAEFDYGRGRGSKNRQNH